MLLGGRDQLDGDKLEAARVVSVLGLRRGVRHLPAVLEAGDDGADKATLFHILANVANRHCIKCEAKAHTWTPSGLIAMKLLRC